MAYTLLNQIFYDANKFDVEPTILKKYMLLSDYVKRVEPNIKKNIEVYDVEPKEEKKYNENIRNIPVVNKIFTPKKEDKLFWCIFTLDIGESEYYMIGNKYKNVEMEEKKKILDYILKNKSTIKNKASTNGIKITNVKMQLIESELMVDKKTTWYAFWIMCMYYKVNVLMVQNNIYMRFHVDNDFKTYLFTRDDNFFISFDGNALNKTKIDEITNNKIEINPFNDKILKGVSTYKIPELEKMMEILHVLPEEDKPKKIDLYNCIILKLVSMKIQN